MRFEASVKYYAFAITYCTFFAVEFVAAFLTKSDALLADAYYSAYSGSLWAIQAFTLVARSRTKTKRNTYGWARFEGFGKLFVAIFACALYFSVSMNSLQKLFGSKGYKLERMYELFLVGFGGIGFCIDFAVFIVNGVRFRATYETDSMNKNSLVMFRSEFEKVLNSAASSLFLLLAALINLLVEGYLRIDLIDGLTALLIITMNSFPLISLSRDSVRTLMQCTPPSVDVEQIESQLKKEFKEILDVHELHVWELCKGEIIVTCHLVFMPGYKNIKYCKEEIEEFLKRAGATKVTVQYELALSLSKTLYNTCLLQCPPNKQCEEKRCCIEHPADAAENI